MQIVQNPVRNNELLEISVFCQKREENNNVKKKFLLFDLRFCRKTARNWKFP